MLMLPYSVFWYEYSGYWSRNEFCAADVDKPTLLGIVQETFDFLDMFYCNTLVLIQMQEWLVMLFLISEQKGKRIEEITFEFNNKLLSKSQVSYRTKELRLSCVMNCVGVIFVILNLAAYSHKFFRYYA